MSWLPDWFSSSDNQSFADANANYSKLQLQYAAQLKRRLDNGEISQAFYDAQMSSIRDTLQDPGDAAWTAFNQAVVDEAKNLPATVQTAIGDTATWVGETVGKTTSNLGGGLFGGLVSNVKFVVGAIVVAIIVWVLWKPLVKPLLDKILIIPV